jgi:hypothetical protein
MAEGAGTSQSFDYQRAVESLGKRDDGALGAECCDDTSHPADTVGWFEAGVRPTLRLDPAWIDDDASDAAGSEIDRETAHDHVDCGLRAAIDDRALQKCCRQWIPCH